MAAIDMNAALAKLNAMRAAGATAGTGEARREAGPEAAIQGSATPVATATTAVPAVAVPATSTPMLGALAALTKLAAATTQSTAVAESAASAAPSAPAAAPPPPLPVNPDLQSQHPELVAQVQALADALHKQEPGIEHWLERIHEQLRAYPELCHILTPEQVRALCSAWMAKTQSYVVTTATKAKSGAKAAKLSGVKLSDDDL